MIPRGVSNRYATALLQAALKKDVAGGIDEDVRGFRRILQENQAYKNFLLSPQILNRDKKDIIEKVLADGATELFIRFLLLLIDKKRLPLIEEVIEAYIFLYERHQGIVEAKVITAVPIDKSTERKVATKLEQETGKRVRIAHAVDPDIIGGMIIIVDDVIVDGSIRHQMTKMRRDVEELRVY